MKIKDDDDDHEGLEELVSSIRHKTVQVDFSSNTIWIDGDITDSTARSVISAFHKIERKHKEAGDKEMGEILEGFLMSLAESEEEIPDLKVTITPNEISFDRADGVVEGVEEEVVDVDSDEPIEVTLYLNTRGGEAAEALPIYDFLRSTRDRFKVTAITLGECMSAGTIIILGAEKRVAYPSTIFLVHSPRLGTYGTTSDIASTAAYLKVMHDMIADIYQEATLLTRAKALKFLSQETYFGAKEALAFGFVNELGVL